MVKTFSELVPGDVIYTNADNGIINGELIPLTVLSIEKREKHISIFYVYNNDYKEHCDINNKYLHKSTSMCFSTHNGPNVLRQLPPPKGRGILAKINKRKR